MMVDDAFICEWQHQGDAWVFGPKIRGVIREPLARVRWSTNCWSIVVGSEPAEYRDSFKDAIEISEKVLGVT